MRATAPTLSVSSVWVFRMYVRRFMGCQNANFVKTSISKPSALGLRFLKGSHPCFPVAPRRPPRPSVNPRPGVRMWSSRRWRASRRASPFLSLSHPSTCAWVRRLNSRTITYILACNTVSFGLDDVLFTAASDSEDFGPALTDSLPPSGQEVRPTLSSWTCFCMPLRSYL